MVKNPAVDEVQEVRQRLIEKFGGLQGYIKHLIEFENTLDTSKMLVASRSKAKANLVARKARKATAQQKATATVTKRSTKRKAS